MAVKKEAARPVAMRCTICQAEVTAETYAAHIQSAHATPPPAPVVSAPFATVGTGASGWWGGSNQQQGPQPIIGPIMGKELAGGQYLKGEDIPDGTTEVRFRIIQFVRDPQGRSKLAAQISETYKKVMFGLNTTNIRALVGLGYTDLQQVVGRTVVCMLGVAANPQKGGMPTKALFISRVE